uniref:Uncharacterized protein n=1 Tax=Anguilla anguilla TaxID=7936 RepID=A0A0E9Q3C6_ANGAN
MQQPFTFRETLWLKTVYNRGYKASLYMNHYSTSINAVYEQTWFTLLCVASCFNLKCLENGWRTDPKCNGFRDSRYGTEGQGGMGRNMCVCACL